MEILKRLSEAFPIGDVQSMSVYGSGHIHDTYLLESASEPGYIAQRFNTSIFMQPDAVEHNYHQLRESLHESSIFQLKYLQGKSGTIFEDIDGEIWRISPFIPGTTTYDTCESDELAYEAASTFAQFISKLTRKPPHLFKNTIPHFLDPAYRYGQFRVALNRSTPVLIEKAKGLIEQYSINDPSDQYQKLTTQLPQRVIHGDTKINNILFRKQGGVCSVIDIDTVMPGYTMCDFGDLIRTTCSTAAEDNPDPEHAGLKSSMYDQIFQAFKEQAFMTTEELSSLDFGAQLMTWLTGIRFLTDYLNGDIYYRINREGHNLDRARSQMNFLIKLKDNK